MGVADIVLRLSVMRISGRSRSEGNRVEIDCIRIREKNFPARDGAKAEPEW